MSSVLGQTWREFEWIVVDDGSSDATPKIPDDCQDARVVRVRLDPNRGVAGARNEGIRRARGELVAFLDDDDEYLPGYLEAVVERFRSGADVVWTGVERVFEQEDGSARVVQQVWPENTALVTALAQLNMSCGLCVRREALNRSGLFDEALRVSEDIDLLLRLGANGALFGCVPRPLIRVHIHRAVSLSRSSRHAEKAECTARMIEKNRSFLEAHPALWMHFHDMLAGDYYRAQRRDRAHHVIADMLRRQPWRIRTWEKWLRFELLKRAQAG